MDVWTWVFSSYKAREGCQKIGRIWSRRRGSLHRWINFGRKKIDLKKYHAFYTSVCGLVEQLRYDSSIGERAISEILYAPTAAGGGSLALLKYAGMPKPDAGELILGFTTSDLEEFIARTVAAGGRVVDPPRDMPDLNLRVAFVEDCEGHLIEVVQMS